ncbi:hypothetical protein [Amycolatopsis anabasis]|uniref:hypothetical protein n=1 Tax=Amycolatopsis anabasis TaxID=1840409 RepID=UPI00131D4FA2|nr:hypothetical protein [Amycolatopsis anabasis]
MTTTKRRTGIIKYLGNMIDDTKDLVDDILDRARDVEHDVRDTARRQLDCKDDDEKDDDTDSDRDLAELKTAVLELTRKVDELATLQQNNKPTTASKTS